ncbi:MAG: nucleoside recognition protein [Clostridia bacterium]|nr:nucleoside recognition protein [Clostridia bacterium]
MLNIIWPIFIILSFGYAIFSGNINNLNNSIFSSTSEAVDLCISLLGAICLWNGIMQIANSTSLISKLTNFLKPLIRFLFPDIKEESEVHRQISLNIVANILGLGNAATPIGLKAMKSMQKDNKNKDTLNNSMITFIVLNTASLQIIPTTVIAIRNSLGSNNPTSVVFPIWISTICAAVAGITATKIFIKFSKKGKN